MLYDVLCSDSGLDPYYEPLAAGKPSLGGGSGIRLVDLMEPMRRARSAFLAQSRLPLTSADLNYGAPRDASLELTDSLSDGVRDYLQFLLGGPGAKLVKFTRMYAKLPELARLDPEAALVHVVRDPRAVATSYLFGRAPTPFRRWVQGRIFFRRRAGRLPWAAGDLSRTLRERQGDAGRRREADVVRVLRVWQHCVRETVRGAAAFGDRMMLVRHEDFASDPAATLNRVYGLLGRTVPEQVLTWATANVRPPQGGYALGDERWQEAFDHLNIDPELQAAGYTR